MLEITRVLISPNLPLIGKDLDAGATLNVDVAANQPDLLAGTIMLITEGATREMVVAPNPIVAPAIDQILGILAQDSYVALDATNAPINRPSMVYRRGVFIRSTINDVGSRTIAHGDASSNILADAGIYLEDSYDENTNYGPGGYPPV